jgi:hypothetical protein
VRKLDTYILSPLDKSLLVRFDETADGNANLLAPSIVFAEAHAV